MQQQLDEQTQYDERIQAALQFVAGYYGLQIGDLTGRLEKHDHEGCTVLVEIGSPTGSSVPSIGDISVSTPLYARVLVPLQAVPRILPGRQSTDIISRNSLLSYSSPS